jgi:UDP-glucose:(heptosyl)LPS alpha-1,3-glucosyltransferase
MKIGLAHKRFELRGGTERVFYRTAVGLRDRGHDVHLFCLKFSIPTPPGITPHRVPGVTWPRTGRLLSFGLFAPLAISRADCDVVLSFDRLLKQDLFRSGGGPHKTFIEKMQRNGGWKSLWYRVSPYHRLALCIEQRQITSGSRRIIAVCEQSKREMIQAYGIAEKKNARVVLFVGTGFRRKGLDRLLRLWRAAAMPNTYLLVVGSDTRLAAYRSAWRQNPYVIFAGPKPNVEDYYAAADVLALPSIQEAFGNVVLEGLAAGLPVITVAGVGAFDKIEGDLRSGILENPDDLLELKDKLLFFLEPTRWSSLSRAARKMAQQYSWTTYLDQLEETLLSLYEQSAATRIAPEVAIPTFSGTPPTH